MEEINLKELMNYFIKRLYLVGIITLAACFIMTFYVITFQKPMYRSSTTILLTKVGNSSDGTITSNDVMLNQKLITTYREIVKSKKVLKRVIEYLNLPYSVEELASNVTIFSVKDTDIIEIMVSDKDNELASHIADTIATVFSKEIRELYKIDNINIIDMAEISNKPFNINPKKQTVMALGAGFVVSFITLLIMYYFDTAIKSVEQVEKELDMPVIGQVPLKKEKKV